MKRSGFHRAIATVLFATFVATMPVALPSHAANGDCGQPVSSGSKPFTSDCLYILRGAIGVVDCEPCVCDTDGNGSLFASDAQRCLRAAVGLDVALSCVDCVTTTTSVPASSSTSTTTTTTLPEPNPACPGYAQWTTHAGYGAACGDNTACAAGVCDESSGRCRTETRWDVGWVGFGHNADLNEGSVERLKVRCDSETAPCGVCEVVGIDPSLDTCRCANDSRAACDEPLLPDFDDCASCSGGANSGKPCESNQDCPGSSCSGAAVCQCFASPPVPVSAGGTPFCFVPRFASEVSGTVDVDTGAAVLPTSMRLAAYIGIGTRTPCPICGGSCSNAPATLCVRDEDCPEGGTCNDDPVANDGVRAGACLYDGPGNGTACDKGAFHSSFPAFPDGPGGGWYSLDCMPAAGTSASGQGLLVSSVRTTGSASLSANLSCAGAAPGASCPCLLCSNDPTVPCNTDEQCAGLPGKSSCTLATSSRVEGCSDNSDCASADAGNCILVSDQQRCQFATSVSCTTNAECQNINLGSCLVPTCSAAGSGQFPQPNGCDNGECSDEGGEVGECSTGPDTKFCAGVVKASGEGLLACASDDDCAPGVIGVDARPCTLVQRLPCFLDPIVAIGSADPTRPVLAETYCVGTMSSAGKNAVFGLPGPARLERQTSLRSYCDADPAVHYSPGVGGCEP